jgi:hypothetical protein
MDKPEPESVIEITDEMIDAGLDAYSDADTNYMRASSIVISIYRAMSARAPKPASDRVPEST